MIVSEIGFLYLTIKNYREFKAINKIQFLRNEGKNRIEKVLSVSALLGVFIGVLFIHSAFAM